METLLVKAKEETNGVAKTKEETNGIMPPITDFSGEKISGEKTLLEVLAKVRNGDFTVRMPQDEIGGFGVICSTLNEIIDLNERMTFEFTKAANTIGKQGNLTQRLELPNSRGSWRSGVESFN